MVWKVYHKMHTLVDYVVIKFEATQLHYQPLYSHNNYPHYTLILIFRKWCILRNQKSITKNNNK